MDEKSECVVETTTLTHDYNLYMKRTLQFLVPFSLFSFLISSFSGFPLFFSYNLQLSNLIFPLFAHALDKKYMFLICNGILAFLAKNLKFSDNGGLAKSPEYGIQQITELPQVLEVIAVQENVASAEYNSVEKQIVTHQEQDENEAEEIETGSFVLDNEVSEEDELNGNSPMEEVNDDARVSVSMEELNKRFEEFIRKMKEEIRFEAQQQLIAV